MHNFKELKIWQRSMVLTEKIYKSTARFPKDEQFGLSSQLKRCACSIPSNIAEGSGRGTNAQFLYFLEISMGSCNELQTQIELAKRLGFISDAESDEILNEAVEIYKMILGFYKNLN